MKTTVLKALLLGVLTFTVLAYIGCGSLDEARKDAPKPTPGKPAAEVTPQSESAEEKQPVVLNERPYYGDLHVHTSLSFDSYILWNDNDPSAAYQFANGETALTLADAPPPNQKSAQCIPQSVKPLQTNNTVQQPKLDPPLDFAAVTDHGEYFGELDFCTQDPVSTEAQEFYYSFFGMTTRQKDMAAFNGLFALASLPEPRRVGECYCTPCAGCYGGGCVRRWRMKTTARPTPGPSGMKFSALPMSTTTTTMTTPTVKISRR